MTNGVETGATGPSDEGRRGVLVIISSPSGAGKTTLARRLLEEFGGQLEFSVSYTTRPIRPGEAHGRDYHFVNHKEFEVMAEGGEFAEHAEVHGNRYGTARATVEHALASGVDVVFDVDWQGGESLRAQWPEDALMCFIVPPDLETLESRLRRRATDAPAVIERRLRGALTELTHHSEYEFVIVNDDLDRAYTRLRAIYCQRRQRLAEPCSPIDDSEQASARRHAETLVAASTLSNSPSN